MEIVKQHLPQIIITASLLIGQIPLRYVAKKAIVKYAQINARVETRVNHIIRIVYIFINIITLLAVVTIWGVDPKNLFIAFSSIFAIIGVGFIAQWSLLSNVTAGIIIFFTTPFRIGDFIRIHDKEVDFEAEIMDIHTFHTFLRKPDGEMVFYPNSLFLQKGVSVMTSDEMDHRKEKNNPDNVEFKG